MHSLCQDVTIDTSSAKVIRFVLETTGRSAYGIGDIAIDSTPAAMLHDTPSQETAADFVKSHYNCIGNVGWYTKGTVTLGEQDYTNAVTMKKYTSDLSSVSFNTENVDSLAFLIGYVDGTAGDGTLKIYKNNQLADTIELTSDMEVMPYSFDTSDASSVTFQIMASYMDSTYALADFKLNAEVTPTEPTEPSTDPTETQEELFGDINGDGFINAADATGILQYAAYAGAGGTASLREFLAGQS